MRLCNSAANSNLKCDYLHTFTFYSVKNVPYLQKVSVGPTATENRNAADICEARSPSSEVDGGSKNTAERVVT